MKEGYPFFGPPLILGLLLFAVGWFVFGTVFILIAVCAALFFRNPGRNTPVDPDAAICPADGRVLEVIDADGFEGSKEPLKKISIFMSVFDVHVNRSPVQGRVTGIRHIPGKFLAAFKPESSERNERNIVRFSKTDGAEVICIQITGAIARRIVCWVDAGADMAMGTPFGMIRFGSRVECYFPASFEPQVEVGDRVRGGETILGRFR